MSSPITSRFIFVLAAASVWIVSADRLQACLRTEDSWTQVSGDGRYILVMVSPKSAVEDGGNQIISSAVGKVRLREHYTESGVYRNDGSNKPLWTLPYHHEALPARVVVDGQYVILGADPCPLALHAVAIYGQGREIVRCYRHDLIACYLSKRVLSLFGFGGLHERDSQWDPKQQSYTMTTEQGERFEFDVATGTTRHWSYFPFLVLGLGTLIPSIVVVIWYRAWLRRIVRLGRLHSRREQRKSSSDIRVCITALLSLSALFTFALIFLGAQRGVLVAFAAVICSTGAASLLFRFSLRSYTVGMVLAFYGCFLGLVVGDVLGELLFRFSTAHIGLVLALPIAGLLIGPSVAGMIERRRYSRLHLE
jgi:hypothetical protein